MNRVLGINNATTIKAYVFNGSFTSVYSVNFRVTNGKI